MGEKVEKENVVGENVVKEKAVKEKKTKEKIPTSLKNSLWNNFFGNCMDGVCQCYFTTPIHSTNFDCGHIVSEKMAVMYI